MNDTPETAPRVTKTLSMPQWLWDKVDEYAAKDNRNRNNFIETAVVRAIENQG